MLSLLSLLTITLPGPSASEVTTYWRYTNLFIIIIITRKVKPIWILQKQETASGSGISWTVCKSAPRSRQIATPVSYHSVFTGRMPFLPPNQQRQSTEGKVISK